MSRQPGPPPQQGESMVVAAIAMVAAIVFTFGCTLAAAVLRCIG